MMNLLRPLVLNLTSPNGYTDCELYRGDAPKTTAYLIIIAN